jgi:hypothetical protein
LVLRLVNVHDVGKHLVIGRIQLVEPAGHRQCKQAAQRGVVLRLQVQALEQHFRLLVFGVGFVQHRVSGFVFPACLQLGRLGQGLFSGRLRKPRAR